MSNQTLDKLDELRDYLDKMESIVFDFVKLSREQGERIDKLLDINEQLLAIIRNDRRANYGE